ncbi:MAG: FecR domain-containing protein, partial [Azonexus sp.]|nr:FecR domain-containing protein [Azonexus sp.]
MSSLFRLTGSLLFALFLAAPLAALAEDDADDPPGRVGRLAVIEGDVSFRLDRDAAAEEATRNWPLSSGAVLETGSRSRAEAWIDATALRLDEDSRLEFAVIDDREARLDLNGGRLAISIMDGAQASDLFLRLPDGQVRFAAAGRYRLEAGRDRSAVTVFAGHASIWQNGSQSQVTAGKRATLFADGNLVISDAGRPDDFDHWVAERENATLASATSRNVSSYMTGYQDLDAYGDWSNNADYGAVWTPRAVATDWAPYRFGRWAWIAPWGWTWIDAAPWGFAPFHYGRWVMLRGRWAWTPGQRAIRPVYAPALVAWIGNPGWSVTFGFGAAPAVGWFPLAPREVYVPRYRYSPTYVRRMNSVHIRDTALIDRAARSGGPANFIYRDNPKAATVVPADRMRLGQAIGSRDFQRVDSRQLQRAPSSATRDWLTPEPRRGGADARPGSAAMPREAAPSMRPATEGQGPRRDDARPAMPAFGETGNRREAQPMTLPSRQPDSIAPRESASGRDMPRNDSAPPPRRIETAPAPATTPTQPTRSAPLPRDEGFNRQTAPMLAPGASSDQAPSRFDRRN